MPDPDADDDELLRDYCASREEGAFRELVERHLPAVWSAARRMVNGDGALAEDIAQEVFAHLAVYAPKLPPRVVLGGWLHRHTCFTAAKAVRAAARRRVRELQHATVTAMNASASDPWPDIAPHLDAALNALSAADRDAVVLRFFEKKDFRSIAATLGTSEDAARMKTGRAVEKLRGMLGKRSAALTVLLLTSLLSDKAVAAPPAALAGRVAHGSLAHVAAAPAAAGWTLFLVRLRPRRAVLTGGAVLALALVAVWHWSGAREGEGRTRGMVARAEGVKPAAAVQAGPPLVEVAYHYFYVPEAQAALLMDARWNGDGDTALLKSLLVQAGGDAAGVQLAALLKGKCAGGQHLKLQKAKEFSYPVSFDPDGEGGLTVEQTATRLIGTMAEMHAVVSEDGETCDLNLVLEHDYAEPRLYRFTTSLTDPENEALPGGDQAEFRSTKVNAQLVLKSGASGLVHSSRLPALAGVPARQLFVFVTVQSICQL